MVTDNLLLASLPEAAQGRLRSRLAPVSLRAGDILHAPGDEIRYAFFLTAGLVSLEYAGADGDTVELATVGRDGMVGIPLVLHDLAVPYRAVARARSTALRVRATVLQGEWQACREVHTALLAYAGRVLNQVSQAALCRQGHTVLQRLCRWLLTAQDQLGTQPIEMTQETLARALGIARPVVAKALLELQSADAIWCRYGRILIRKRPMLESTVCECYQVAHLSVDLTVPLPPPVRRGHADSVPDACDALQRSSAPNHEPISPGPRAKAAEPGPLAAVSVRKLPEDPANKPSKQML
jgi:CRP-like cAMP-binding protein